MLRDGAALRVALDVDRLHELLEAIPAGRWVAYADLSAEVGTAGHGMANHIKACVQCENAWRVLHGPGRLSPAFVRNHPTDRRTQSEALADDGVRYVDGLADPAQRIDVAELVALADLGFTWPSVEWVKVPTRLSTGTPNGTPIAMRHLDDCSHWFRRDAGDPTGELVGERPFRASNDQMANLKPCSDCVRRARAGGDLPRGRRRRAAMPLPVDLGVDPTDALAMRKIRREQRGLRDHLLGDADTGRCSLCGDELPVRLLVAAHIVPRWRLSDTRRRDYAREAFLACLLGCDAIFEHGYVGVDDAGRVTRLRSAPASALAAAVDLLHGREAPGFTPARAAGFAQHRALHTD